MGSECSEWITFCQGCEGVGTQEALGDTFIWPLLSRLKKKASGLNFTTCHNVNLPNRCDNNESDIYIHTYIYTICTLIILSSGVGSFYFWSPFCLCESVFVYFLFLPNSIFGVSVCFPD